MAKLFTKYTPLFVSSTFLMGSAGSILVTEDKEKLKALSKPVAEGMSFSWSNLFLVIFVVCLVASIYFLWADIRESDNPYD